MPGNTNTKNRQNYFIHKLNSYIMHSMIVATSAIANKKYSRYDEDSATNCENNQCFHFPINFDISKFFILANFFWDILD